MATVKQLQQQIEESTSLKYIAQAYTEISATKLKRIRNGIEKNRLFFEEILSLLHIVQGVATKRHIQVSPRSRDTISVVLTSNYRFTGNLEHRLLYFFMMNIAKGNTDCIVIGKTGQEFLRSINYSHPFKSVIFAKDVPSGPELKSLNTLMGDYQKVVVFHPKMKSVLIQEPVRVEITQAQPEQAGKSNIQIDYIFEPEIADILLFFENQITQLLLEQTFFESELARTAARLISMDNAQVNADKVIHEQKIMLGQAKRSQMNMQLLETAASLLKWRKENR